MSDEIIPLSDKDREVLKLDREHIMKNKRSQVITWLLILIGVPVVIGAYMHYKEGKDFLITLPWLFAICSVFSIPMLVLTLISSGRQLSTCNEDIKAGMKKRKQSAIVSIDRFNKNSHLNDGMIVYL
ncbi:hypothetical protein AB9P05_18540 [Roseivirga sp. BDSF3-8]|uniref:hypothetical protein n=1 Tax=Roseivirga sp. BDSF3-8 TaxID=3241598 RepID=UPI003531A7B4